MRTIAQALVPRTYLQGNWFAARRMAQLGHHTQEQEVAMTSEQKGLRLAAGVTVAFGLALALAAFPPTAAPMVLLADLLIWPLDGVQTGTASETRLIFAILGGIAAGWGWLIWQLAGAPMERDPELVRGLIRQSALVWFITDSTASVLAGAPLNVAANVGFLALFLIPMLRGGAARPA
jgi:hypothetical protein